MSLNHLRTTALLLLTLWFSLILINNLTDPGTNTALIAAVVSMEGLRADPAFGNGLLWRAVAQPQAFAEVALKLVIAYQLCLVMLLWRAVWHNVRRSASAQALAAANLGIALMCLQGVGLMLMGLYFGYWLHFGGPQLVHLLILLSSLGLAILFNVQPRTV
ncbi:MAG: DUF2165 family protein [Neisseriaceae bacterium]|nr:DUF2165 family protein [Neisseriaceae bacterium]